MNEYESRDIPFKIKILSLFQGFSSQFGWLFFGFGMIFVWFFAFNADLSSIFPEKYSSKSTGYVIDSIPTSMSENNRRIFKITFRFRDNHGEEHISSSFSKISIPYNKNVRVIYNSENPKKSKIMGARTKPFGPLVLFVLIFPITGLIFIVFSIKHGFKINRLLRYGAVATGILQNMKSTNTRINNQTVYKFTFLFKDRSGQEHVLTQRTHLRHLLTNSKEKRLLYLPGLPEYGVMMDTIPGNIRINFNGRIEFEIKKPFFALFIAPIIAIVSNIIFIYIRFFI